MNPISEEVCNAAICVLNLDADGRLTAQRKDFLHGSLVRGKTVEQSRQALMRLDPVGCEARDVRECLLVQLEVAENAIGSQAD